MAYVLGFNKKCLMNIAKKGRIGIVIVFRFGTKYPLLFSKEVGIQIPPM
jgi:hypothetical protein